MVSLSTSTKTGTAPAYTIALVVAIKVKGCVITSSPSFTPLSLSAIWSALVPFTHTTACLAPV